MRILLQFPPHSLSQVLGKSNVFVRNKEFDLLPGTIVRTFRLHEHGRFCLLCAVSSYQGTGLHPGMLDSFCQSSLYEGVDGNACLCRQVGDFAMRVGSNTDIECSGKTFLGSPTVVTAKSQIILNSFVEGIGEFLQDH